VDLKFSLVCVFRHTGCLCYCRLLLGCIVRLSAGVREKREADDVRVEWGLQLYLIESEKVSVCTCDYKGIGLYVMFVLINVLCAVICIVVRARPVCMCVFVYARIHVKLCSVLVNGV